MPLIALLLILSTVAAATPVVISPSTNVNPANYVVTTFASGSSYPQSLVTLPDNSLLVGSTIANPSFGTDSGYYTGFGQLLRFVDADHNGVADGAGTVVASVTGAVTSVRSAGELALVGTTGDGTGAGSNAGSLTFLKPGANPNDTYSQVGQIQFAFPHASNNLATTVKAGAAPGTYDVYFIIGAQDYSGAPGGDTVLTGLVNATLPGGSLYRTTVTITGGVPSATTPVQLASGIRNTSGLVIDATGNVLFSDNGVEILPSADELNRWDAGSAGVVNFGYPSGYVDVNSGVVVGVQQPPVTAFTDKGGGVPLGMSEIAFAPSAFPGLSNSLFATFFGNYFNGGQNPVMLVNLSDGSAVPFVAAGLPGIGQITSAWSTADALYLADFSSGGFFQPGTGTIYKITVAADSVPEPSTWQLLATGLVSITWLTRRANRKRASRLTSPPS